MRILLVNTNRERRPYPVVPLGLACVAQALARAGHEVTVADLAFARDPCQAIARSARACRPAWIGLSIRNLDNSSFASPHSYLGELRQVVAACRRAAGVPLVVGGAAAGIAPAALLADLSADYAIPGEGEETAPALARALEAGEDPAAVPGVLAAGSRSMIERPRAAALPALGDLPRFIATAPYLRAGAPLPLQARRGCAYRCVYCTYPGLEGAAYRLKEPAQVAAEALEMSRRAGSRSFEFVDSTFNAPLPYTVELCEALARLPFRSRLQASGFTPAHSSAELLAAMRRAGFDTLVCSPDSASDAVLSALGKGFGREDLERLVGEAHRAGMVAMWAFLFGGPGETEQTARETLRFIGRRLSRTDLVFIAAGLRIYPGTPLESLARAEGLLAPAEDLLAPRFYLSPGITPELLRALFDEHLAGVRNCIFLSDLQHGLVPWLERAAAAVGLPGPLWRYAPHLRRLIPHRSRILP